MIFGLELTLFLYLFLACVYWLVKDRAPYAALGLLVTANVVLLYVANPLLFIYLTGQILWVWILFQILRRLDPRSIKTWPWLTFLGLVPVNLNTWMGPDLAAQTWVVSWGNAGWQNIFWTVGSTFFVAKSFVVLKESLKDQRFEALPALAALTFVPSFSAGPIHGGALWKPSHQANSITPRDAAQIFLKIGWGAAALMVLAPWLKAQAKALASSPGGWIADVYLSFAALYFDFSGYSLLAIACAAMFGVRLPENFNRPYLATNIQEFWQRWHMSLNAFIGTYLFKPMVRATGSPRLAIFIAFVCVGVWHKASLGYLAWGLGHGVALILFMNPPHMWVVLCRRLPAGVVKLLSWALTMTWVATLSFGANRLPY